MRQIRENIWEVSYSEIGEPFEKGYYNVPNFGELLIDAADVRYIEKMKSLGLPPTFFISKSDVLHGYVVVSRQQKS